MTHTHSRRRFICLAAVLGCQTALVGDLFVGPSTPSNRFTLAAGQAALISAVYPQAQYDENLNKTNSVPVDASIVFSGETNSVYAGECKHGTTALVGPMELVVSSPVVITYKTLTNTALQCLVVKPGTTNTLSVPSGRSIRFLTFGLDGYEPVINNASLSKGGASFQGADIYGNSEFDGPLSISFIYPILPNQGPGFEQKAFTLPYYLTEQAVVLPDQSALQAPTGGFEIEMQKSFDLKTWFPSVSVSQANDQKAFYRLRLSQ